MLVPLEIEDYAREDSKSQPMKEESANGAVDANLTDDDATLPPRHSDVRTRPSLPRRAKENKCYTMNTVSSQNGNAGRARSIAYWQRWLLIALLASMTASAQAREKGNDTIQCIKGGISIQTQQIQGKIQVCSEEYCLEVENPNQNVKIQFPPEITLHSYQIVDKTLLGNSTQAFHWACPPNPFCE